MEWRRMANLPVPEGWSVTDDATPAAPGVSRLEFSLGTPISDMARAPLRVGMAVVAIMS